MTLILTQPSLDDAASVMAYRQVMLANGDILHGCAGLEDTTSYEEWLDFDHRLRRKFGNDYAPETVFLAIRQDDRKLLGIIDFRNPISEKLLKFGGHVGYSVLPSERRKGVATEMLRCLLPHCRQAGLNRILLTCAKENIASRNVIVANGGQLENEVPDAIGISRSGIILRFWIPL
jgi:predicted acetyltransferase